MASAQFFIIATLLVLCAVVTIEAQYYSPYGYGYSSYYPSYYGGYSGYSGYGYGYPSYYGGYSGYYGKREAGFGPSNNKQ